MDSALSNFFIFHNEIFYFLNEKKKTAKEIDIAYSPLEGINTYDHFSFLPEYNWVLPMPKVPFN